MPICRTARDGQNYTRTQFLEYYGEENGEREWQAAQVPSVATEHAVSIDTKHTIGEQHQTDDKIKRSNSLTDKISITEPPRPKRPPPQLPTTPQLANACSNVTTNHAVIAHKQQAIAELRPSIEAVPSIATEHAVGAADLHPSIENVPSVATEHAVGADTDHVHIKRDVLQPLLDQCQWDAQNLSWRLPQTQPDARLLAWNWQSILRSTSDKVAVSVLPTFYPREPDHNQRNAPRLDIVVSFADGTWVRYHPRAQPIWSDEFQPTDAMIARYNLAAKLAKEQQC